MHSSSTTTSAKRFSTPPFLSWTKVVAKATDSPRPSAGAFANGQRETKLAERRSNRNIKSNHPQILRKTHNEKGCGFLEAVYQECLEIELGLQGIPFDAKKPLTLAYKGHELEKKYEPDFLCFGKIIIEIKAVSSLCDDHRAQLLNYLNATGMRVGLLLNFGHHPKLEYERMVHTPKKTRE
jgi:GxxExxY protein